MDISIFKRTFAAENKYITSMDNKSAVRVVGFPKANYTKKWLDTLNDAEKSDTALADGNAEIFVDLEEFQDVILNSEINAERITSNWWYFLND